MKARAVALLAALALGGCMGDDEPGTKRDDGSAGAQSPKQEVRTTKVEVVEGLGSKGGLNAAALYDRLSPGVVTIESLFADGGASLLEEEGGEGSGTGAVG